MPDSSIDLLKQTFFSSVSAYLPKLDYTKLYPDYAGIRPKLGGPGDRAFRDFIIQEEQALGFPGLVNLIGIESPGLTSSLAIGDLVANKLAYSNICAK